MRGNFVSPIGNPYYEPDYEKYYYDPPWYDRLQDPESWHDVDQTLRSAARTVGPLLPAAAAALPIGAVGYTLYENIQSLRKAKERQRRVEKRRLLAEKRTLKQARETNKKIGTLIEELNKAGIKNYPAITGPASIPLGEVEMDISPSTSPSPSPRPDAPPNRREPSLIPSVHVDLPDKIYKMSVGGEDKINSSAEEIVHQINMHGYDPVLKLLKKDSPFRTILEDIPGALLGPDYFPKPFYRYLDEETRERYSKVHKPKDYIGDDARRRERDGDHEANRYLEMHPSTKQKLDAARKKQSVVQNISSKPRSKRNRSTPRTSRGEKSSSLVSLVPAGIVRTPEGMRMLRIQTLMQMGMSREDAIRAAESKVSEVSKQFNK